MTHSDIKDDISLIDNTSVESSDPEVKAAISYVSSNGAVDNMYKAMMQSPKVIKPIHDLYLALLHDNDSPLENWIGELLSVQVAVLNKCSYALAHHSANLKSHLDNTDQYRQYMSALGKQNYKEMIDDPKIVAMLDYGEKLCLHPNNINAADLDLLRKHGLSEKEIVFIAQINAGFAYWTRILNALGVELAGEPIGLAAKSQA